MPRQHHCRMLVIVTVSVFLGLGFVLTFRNKPEGTRNPNFPVRDYTQAPLQAIDQEILHGTATAPKLENATVK